MIFISGEVKPVTFVCLNQLLAVAAFGQILGTEYQVKTDRLEVSFSDYIKSQLDNNVVSQLFDRKDTVYYEANKYMLGIKEYRDSAIQCLKYFYKDLYLFLCRNAHNVQLKIVVDLDLDLKTYDFDYQQVRQEIQGVLTQPKDGLHDYLSNHTYTCIIDECCGSSDLLQKIDNYSLAAVIKTACFTDEPVKLCQKG